MDFRIDTMDCGTHHTWRVMSGEVVFAHANGGRCKTQENAVKRAQQAVKKLRNDCSNIKLYGQQIDAEAECLGFSTQDKMNVCEVATPDGPAWIIRQQADASQTVKENRYIRLDNSLR